MHNSFENGLRVYKALGCNGNSALCTFFFTHFLS